ncbi:MAG TPA: spore coat associated protein CotJA [Clostridiales bacterium]|nr:spore coat associated protein CotJA [Clostridiales bacterium]
MKMQEWTTGNIPGIPSVDESSPYHGGMYQQYQCIPQELVIRNVKLARAYVPFQKLCSLYPPEIALHKGTVFPELYSPYMVKKEQKIVPIREECGDGNE